MVNSIKKTVLAIDTALGGVSVGIMATNGHIVSRIIETAREQAVILVPTIQEVVREAEIEFSDIDLIICSRGPGSFTGLRIGLATARTMALTLDKPIIGLNTLDTMARHYYSTPCTQARGLNETGRDLLIVLETKRQDFYARYYDSQGEPLTEPFATDAEEVLNRAPVDVFNVGGDCLERFKASPCLQAGGQDGIASNITYLDDLTQPDPILMAQYGLELFEEQGEQGTPQPLYLRGADVSYPKNPPRKLAEA
jgi:tRNA threonylcarbamoyladenosine biosynthesis protein TsaB